MTSMHVGQTIVHNVCRNNYLTQHIGRYYIGSTIMILPGIATILEPGSPGAQVLPRFEDRGQPPFLNKFDAGNVGGLGEGARPPLRTHPPTTLVQKCRVSVHLSASLDGVKLWRAAAQTILPIHFTVTQHRGDHQGKRTNKISPAKPNANRTELLHQCPEFMTVNKPEAGKKHCTIDRTCFKFFMFLLL